MSNIICGDNIDPTPERKMMIALTMKKFLIVISASPFLLIKKIPPVNELEVCVAVKCELPTSQKI
jgi:hypothetical protein